MLVLDRIRRAFGSVVAVRDISFSVPTGAVFGLIGPNGAGKTTTMRMILGIYPPDGGTIRWNEKPIDEHVRRRFGYLPEERGLYGSLRVRDQIVYFGRLHGLSRADARARADEWLAMLGIEEYAKRKTSELSKGNQQKVQMATAAMHAPEVLILDEPFSGLDPVNAEAVLECIRTLASRGTTLLLSSHQMWHIEDVCDAFCIIAAGEVRALGTLDALRATFPTRSVRVAPALPEIRAVFERRGYGEGRAAANGELTFTLPATSDFGGLLRECVAAGPLVTFERAEPSLDEIYSRTITQASNGTPA
jgi:ABC-2 type transport system ATP-binding protein